MPRQHLGDHLVERSRKAWWTAYVLDREMTSLMGLPQSINDDDVHPSLPHFSGSSHRVTALNMQIRLSRTIAAINRGKQIIIITVFITKLSQEYTEPMGD